MGKNNVPLLILKGITKNFGETKVLKGIDLTINQNEFVTLLGPSGCGKTTTLRIIGGFEHPSSGNVIFDGQDITNLPPYKRSMNTVFQSYALFPHMDVYDNIAFGARLSKKTNFKPKKPKHYSALIKKDKSVLTEEERSSLKEYENELSAYEADLNDYYKTASTFKEKIQRLVRYCPKKVCYSEKEIKAKADAVIKLVNLQGMENRNVSHLSGGQRQRVAIARAIILRPKLLLLDESLSALDLKLRKEMQYELKELQKSTGITFVFVTHDQEEALTMSDKIVVMKDGYIEQVGRAEEIYNEPIDKYVANFIGDSNILKGKIVDPRHVEFDGETFLCRDIKFPIGSTVDVMLRPEDLEIVYPSKGRLLGITDSIFFKGVFYEVDVRLENDRIITIHTTDYVPVGKQVGVTFDTEDITLMEEM